CWLPVGGALARPGVTTARLEVAGTRCGFVRRTGPLSRSAWRHGPRPSVPWAHRLRAGNLHARTPSRQVERRGSRAEADAVERFPVSGRTAVPRLHQEEGDGMIIDTPRREIKSVLIRPRSPRQAHANCACATVGS